MERSRTKHGYIFHKKGKAVGYINRYSGKQWVAGVHGWFGDSTQVFESYSKAYDWLAART